MGLKVHSLNYDPLHFVQRTEVLLGQSTACRTFRQAVFLVCPICANQHRPSDPPGVFRKVLAPHYRIRIQRNVERLFPFRLIGMNPRAALFQIHLTPFQFDDIAPAHFGHQLSA